MGAIARLIAEVLAAPEDAGVQAAVRERVRRLCGRFPLYTPAAPSDTADAAAAAAAR